MTPQEKATDIVKKYGTLAEDHVQEIIDLNVEWVSVKLSKMYPHRYHAEDTLEFWYKVQTIIKHEKLPH